MPSMSALDRSLAFLAGKPVDRPPCHPILMRWAARYAGVKYKDFCLTPEDKCRAAIQCAHDFDLDWVTVMSDPYVEAEAFGLVIEYPEDNLPLDRGGHLADLDAVRALGPYVVDGHARMEKRIREIEIFKKEVGDELFIVGWVEGPIAEYGDIRGLTAAAMDFLDDEEAVTHALDVITESALPFITRQIEAGAHCVGIGDAFCSQIGPNLYRQFAFEREQRMVDHIHSLGAMAKLHICGNTDALLPDMIATGADIIDVDHLVPSLAKHAGRLAPNQVFCGKVDPVSIVQNGTPEAIMMHVRKDMKEAGGRCIVSAGCEITPDTSEAHLRALRQAADAS